MSELSPKFPPLDFAAGEKLGLNEQEWRKLTKGLGRAPNEIECAIAMRLWSDDVIYKHGRMFLRGVFRESPAATFLPGRKAALFEIGFGEQLAVTYDQISSVVNFEPRLGAIAGLGNAVDELAALGAEPAALFAMAHVGHSDDSRSHDRLNRIIDGAAEFSRRSGTALAATDTFFDSRYDTTPLAAAGAVGIVRAKPGGGSVKQVKKVVLYVGSRTRREGTGFDLRTPIVDPYFGAILRRALEQGHKDGLILAAVHLTTGGLARGAFELAVNLQSGLRLFLNQIPTVPDQQAPKAPGVGEILFSESAERYLVAVDSVNYRSLSEALLRYGLEVIQLGEMISTSEVEFDWNHQALTLLPYQVIMEDLIEKTYQLSRFPPMLRRSDDDIANSRKGRKVATSGILSDLWIDLLAHPNVHMRSRAMELVDTSRGRRIISIEGSTASIVRISHDGRERALVMTVASTPRYSRRDPYLGAVHSVATGMRSLAAVGALPIAASQALFVGDPNDYRQLSEFSEVVRGASDSCRAWMIPILTDSVKFSNATNPPIPTASMFLAGVLGDVRKTVPPSFQAKGHRIIVIGTAREELGESQYYATLSLEGEGFVPDIDFDLERRTCECIFELIQQGLLISAHPVAQGGLAVALAESALLREKPIGFQLELKSAGEGVSGEALLFAETASRFVVSCEEQHVPEIRQLIQQCNLEVAGFGTVGGKELKLSGAVSAEIPLSTADRVWTGH